MAEADLPVIYPLGESVHVDHPESPAVQPNRLSLFPEGCLVLEESGSGWILGYCISHPAIVGCTPALDSFIERIPEGADCLYIHDVCLRPEWRGRGFTGSLVERLRTVARSRGFTQLALTAVSGAEEVWFRLGFRVIEADDALRTKLATYGGPAFHMVSALDSTAGDQ